ncbi:MAG: VOC family protein [Promethearchaeota archaeon]
MKFDEFITFLGTENLNKTSEFYQNGLGLEIYKDQGLCKIFHVTKESKVGFCSHMSVVFEEKSPIITLVVKNVDETYQKLIQNGIEIPNLPKVNSKFNIYNFFFKDPNGYTVEIQKFLD